MAVLQFRRGHDPAASERVIVPLSRQMDDDELDALYESTKDPNRMELLAPEAVALMGFWLGLGIAAGLLALVVYGVVKATTS